MARDKRRRTESGEQKVEKRANSGRGSKAEESVAAGAHTILLMQPESNPMSRTYFDYQGPSGMAQDLVAKYEQRLRKLNPSTRNFTYDVKDLYAWLDGLHDLSALVFSGQTTMYQPFGLPWIKKKVLNHLKRQARAAQHK